MTRYALISDIHGNIDALRAVAEHIRAGPTVDEIICLGDVIGYCPAPNEVVELLRSLEAAWPVRYNLGSHDGAALGLYQFVDLTSETDADALRAAGLADGDAVIDDYLNTDKRRFVPVRPDARNAMKWTLDHLTPDSRQFLKERLQARLEIEPGIISVHASPRDHVCEYIRDSRYAQRCFESPDMDGAWLCFVGHTHLSLVWRMDRTLIVQMGSSRLCLAQPKADFAPSVQFNRDTSLYIANVGSVGQPRDRDPRAAYARFNSPGCLLEHVRVEYDVAAAAARIREAGLSERLAERLFLGQ